jgi:hypothetical protein
LMDPLRAHQCGPIDLQQLAVTMHQERILPACDLQPPGWSDR